MIIEEALYNHISTNPTVASLATDPDTGVHRGYPVKIPQDVDLPAWAYQRISGGTDLAHDGPTGVARGRFQFSAVGHNYGTAKYLINAIRQSVEGFRGIMGSPGGVSVFEVGVEAEYDSQGSITGNFTIRLDVFVLYCDE